MRSLVAELAKRPCNNGLLSYCSPARALVRKRKGRTLGGYYIMRNKVPGDRPRLIIVLTRDSVCLADDCDAPHEKSVKIDRIIDPVQFIRQISADYLPLKIAGVGYSWDCLLNDIYVGTVSRGCIGTTIRASVKEISYLEKNHVHFIYNP